MAKKNTDVAVTEPEFSDAQLLAAKSFDDMLSLVTEQYGSLVNVSEVLGDGFTLLSTADKSKLVGVPFIIVDSRMSDGDNGTFVTLRVVTQNGGKFIINDGSTGIRDQMLKLCDLTGRSGGFTVMNGLTRSDYTNEHGNATTYYLSLSNGEGMF